MWQVTGKNFNMRTAWTHISEKEPFAQGKYWVYPYVTLEGHKIVALATYSKNKWEETHRPQHYMYWKKLDIPSPPKEKYGSGYVKKEP